MLRCDQVHVCGVWLLAIKKAPKPGRKHTAGHVLPSNSRHDLQLLAAASSSRSPRESLGTLLTTKGALGIPLGLSSSSILGLSAMVVWNVVVNGTRPEDALMEASRRDRSDGHLVDDGSKYTQNSGEVSCVHDGRADGLSRLCSAVSRTYSMHGHLS